jgi:hypothetical protein
MDITDKPKLEIINGGRANLERSILTLLLQSFGSSHNDRSELDRLIAILHRHAELSVVNDQQVKASGNSDETQGDRN